MIDLSYYQNAYYINVERDEKVEKLILQYGKRKELAAKEFLVWAGKKVSTINYLLSGQLVHYGVNDQGDEKVGYINNPGSFTNELIFLVHSGSLIPKRFVVAKQNSEVCVIDKACFEILRQNTECESYLLQSLYQKYRILREEVDSFAFNSAQQRLLNLFTASIDEKNLQEGEVWLPLYLSYTQQEMAAIIGVHRVSVARIINNLCNAGIIRTVNHKMEINIQFYLQNQQRRRE